MHVNNTAVYQVCLERCIKTRIKNSFGYLTACHMGMKKKLSFYLHYWSFISVFFMLNKKIYAPTRETRCDWLAMETFKTFFPTFIYAFYVLLLAQIAGSFYISYGEYCSVNKLRCNGWRKSCAENFLDKLKSFSLLLLFKQIRTYTHTLKHQKNLFSIFLGCKVPPCACGISSKDYYSGFISFSFSLKLKRATKKLLLLVEKLHRGLRSVPTEMKHLQCIHLVYSHLFFSACCTILCFPYFIPPLMKYHFSCEKYRQKQATFENVLARKSVYLQLSIIIWLDLRRFDCITNKINSFKNRTQCYDNYIDNGVP